MPRLGLIYSSDFDTLKNDDSATGRITIPASGHLAASAQASFSVDVAMGQAASLLMIRMQTSLNPARWNVITAAFGVDLQGTINFGTVVPYTILVSASHTGGNTVRLLATIQNPYATQLTYYPADVVIDFMIRSFMAPDFN